MAEGKGDEEELQVELSDVGEDEKPGAAVISARMNLKIPAESRRLERGACALAVRTRPWLPRRTCALDHRRTSTRIWGLNL